MGENEKLERVLLFGEGATSVGITGSLAAAGLAGRPAAELADAIATLRKGEVDGMIVDISDPVLNGWRLLVEAEAIRPVPAVVICRACFPEFNVPLMAEGTGAKATVCGKIADLSRAVPALLGARDETGAEPACTVQKTRWLEPGDIAR